MLHLRGERVAPNVGLGWLGQDRNGQNLGNVIHACAKELAPGIAVILEAAGMEACLHPGTGKEMKMADASKILEHQFAFDRLALDAIAPDFLGGVYFRMRSPDQPSGNASEVLRITR